MSDDEENIYGSSQARDLYFEKNQKLYQNQSSNGETLPKLNIGIHSKFDQY